MPRPRLALTLSMFLAASSVIAQQAYRPPDPHVMARLSYGSSGMAQRGDLRHVCVAVDRDGAYRIVRRLDDGQTQRLHGKMSKEELQRLSTLLGTAEFRNLSGDHGGLIRQQSESFVAEVPSAGRALDGTGVSLEPEAWHLQWLNGDGENPFPLSVGKVVDWLQHFQPKDGKPFQYAEYPDVCPAAGLRLLQPSVAENSQP